MKLNLLRRHWTRRIISKILDELWRIRCPDTANTHFLFSLVQWVHCSTLLVNTNLLQICYKQNTQVGKESSQVFFHGFLISFSSIFLNQTPSLPPSLRRHPSPATKIFTYVLRHLKVFSNKVEVSNPFLFVCNEHKSNKKTQVEQGKEEHWLSYDAFLHSDLFRRWFCDTSSSSRTGTTRAPGSGGYRPARR